MSDDAQPPELVMLARDLRDIETLTADLDDQAAHRGGDPRMPGGVAMVMLSPVANLEARENLVDATESLIEATEGRRGDLSHLDDEDPEWEPPLQTLLFWTEAWRVEHGNVTDMRPTIATEAAYLRQLLNWAWEHEPRFADVAADIRKARVRLEDALYAGVRVERTDVPCVEEACERKPRLIRVYGDSVADDHYRCPNPACRAKYDQSAFARAKLRMLTSRGADRWVLFQDARDAVERSETTFRKWMTTGLVRTICDIATHRKQVWWPDVRDVNQETARRSHRRVA